MTEYTAETLDLSRLSLAPLFDVDHQQFVDKWTARFVAIWNGKRALDPTLPEIDPVQIHSMTAQILREEFAFGAIDIVQMINDAAKALRLAQATGDGLEHLTATYHGTQRQVLVPSAGNQAAVMEGDDELRRRAQLAPEALAEFGLSAGAYIYQIRTAFAAQIKDVRPIRLSGGGVELRLLGRAGNGQVPNGVLAEVIRAFQGEADNQSTDILSVFSAEIDTIVPQLRLQIPRGPAPDAVIAEARASLIKYRDERHRIGASIWLEALAAAAKVGPVIRPIVLYPAAHVIGSPRRAPWLADFVIETEVVT